MMLYCIRHTNVDVLPGTCYGQSDVGLANSYPEEKEAVWMSLNGIEFDQIYSSPLKRCKALAEDIFPNSDIIVDDRLKELNFGEWEMKSWDEVFKSRGGKEWMDNYREQPCDGGESYPEFRERVLSFLNDFKTSTNKNVAVITHGGVIRIIKSLIENQPFEKVLKTFTPVFGGVYPFELK